MKALMGSSMSIFRREMTKLLHKSDMPMNELDQCSNLFKLSLA